MQCLRKGIRGSIGFEYWLLPGEYMFLKGVGYLLVHNMSNNVILFHQDSLITRARLIEVNKDVLQVETTPHPWTVM